MRITVTAPSLRRDGGVERITALLANALAESGHDVAMVTRNRTAEETQRLHRGIDHQQMYVPRGPKPIRNAQLALVVGSLRRTFGGSRPDVVIGSRWDCAILSLLATRGVSTPVVAWEHGYLPLARLTKPWKALRARLYPRAAAIVLVNEGSRAAAEQLVDGDRITVIHNFVANATGSPGSVAQSLWASFPGGRPPHGVVAVGRLEPEKGFDLLIEAYAAVGRSFPDWGLLIAGRGSMHHALEALAARLGAKGRIHVAGATNDPFPTLADSDAFVLPSRHEGFGLALIEAMSVGLPAVAFDCPGGPREIVRHGVDGLLVPNGDTNALAAALGEIMSDASRRAAMAQEARRVEERFSEERALLVWNELLTRVRQSRPPVDDRARR